MIETLALSDLAKTEDDPMAETPLKPGIGVIAKEPALAISIALNVEHDRVAVGAGNPFHRHPHVVTFRLIVVLEAEVRAVFSSAEFDDLSVEVFSAPLFAEFRSHELVSARVLGKAEFGQTEGYEAHGLLFGGDSEGRFSHDVFRPVTAHVFEASNQILLRHSADLDGFPRRQGALLDGLRHGCFP